MAGAQRSVKWGTKTPERPPGRKTSRDGTASGLGRDPRAGASGPWAKGGREGERDSPRQASINLPRA